MAPADLDQAGRLPVLLRPARAPGVRGSGRPREAHRDPPVITGVVAPHTFLQPKGRWIRHLHTQLNSVESTLDIIADYADA